jgi:hypothetical protein
MISGEIRASVTQVTVESPPGRRGQVPRAAFF